MHPVISPRPALRPSRHSFILCATLLLAACATRRASPDDSSGTYVAQPVTEAGTPSTKAESAPPTESAPPPPAALPESEPAEEDSRYTTCPTRRAEMCTKEYRPVCADVDTGIRCIRAPCPSIEKKTYGNACSACADPKVIGHRPGPCPAGQPETDLPQGPRTATE